MRKFTKLMLTLALLVVGVGGAKVYAGKTYASINQPGYVNATWNSETNTMSWTGVWATPSGGGGTWYFLQTGLPDGNITSYTKVHATLASFSDNVDHIWLRVKCKKKSNSSEEIYADKKLVAGENNVDLVALATDNEDADFSKVVDITLWGAREPLEGKTIGSDANTASVVITDVYMLFDPGLDAATERITAGKEYFISCVYNEKTYYLQDGGTLTSKINEATAFTFNTGNTEGGYESTAWFIQTGGKRFTNPDGYAPTLLGYLRQSTESRIWESQVLYYNGSKFAIRCTNATGSAWGPSRFWTVTTDAEDKVIAEYTTSDNDVQFVWSLTNPLDHLIFNEYGIATTDKGVLTATGGLSYNSSTGVLTSNGEYGELVLQFVEPIDLRNLNYFNVKRSGDDDLVENLYFYEEDGTEINTWGYTKFDNTWRTPGCDNNATKAFINHKPVKKLVWKSTAGEAKKSKTLTINSIEWTLKTISCSKAGETQLKTLDWNKVDGTGTATPNWNMNGTSDTYYGDYSGNATHYADLTDYSELRIYCKDNNTGFRCFFINAAGTGTNQIHTAAASWNAEGKYYSLDLSTIEKWDSKVALKSMKAENDREPSGRNITNIIVYNTPVANAPQYTLTGSGMQLAETEAALADASATSIDATGVTALTTDPEYSKGQIGLTSANPNCLFLASAKQLSNANNVIVSGTCDNLVLTDNYPFKAPADFTVKAASYTTTINTTAMAGTLCLPFAATIPGGVEAYTLTYTSGDKAPASAVETTIPANTPVFLTGSGSATFTGSSASIDADASNVYGALTGVFASTTVPTGSYVLQNGAEGLGFYKVTDGDPITAKPFRAYLTASTPARSLSIVFADETTGISEVSVVKDKNYFNLGGQRVSKPAKGLYIMNGKKVMIK